MSINKIKDNYDNRRAFTTRPDRAIEMGGFAPSASKDGTTIQMAAGGTSTDFGDLIATRDLAGGMSASSTTRALFYGGESSGNVTDIDSMQLASTGNASDHGDLTVAIGYAAATSNGVRAFCAGGTAGPAVNTIDFGSIAQTGNFTDFGDLSVSRNAVVGICSPVRGLFAGGTDGTSPSPGYQNVIDYITINSTGNATDFGDLSGKSGYMSAANDSSGKAYFIGGATGGDSSKNNEATDVVTIASTGNATQFGTLTQMTRSAASVSQGTTAITLGGANPSTNNVMQRFVMPSLGNATDFGDLNRSVSSNKGGCGSHDGIDWGSAAVQRPSVTYMPGSGRMLLFGGYNDDAGAATTDIDMITIPTLGNAVDFGTMTTARRLFGGFSDRLRATAMGGVSNLNSMETILFSSFGNTFDFGDLTTGVHFNTGLASVTRGINAGGITPSFSNVISYVTIASASNATDFGDLTAAISGTSGASSSVRGIFAAGNQASPVGETNVISYITIASTGNATDFGDTSGNTTTLGGTSSSTRAVYAGGSDSAVPNEIQYVTIASTGNTTDFGDLTQGRGRTSAGSNSIRGVFGGGTKTGAPAYPDTNVMDYITIASTGNAADFGDLTRDRSGGAGCSDNHGGLQA